jgi:large subunit ribosomal protein L3
LFFNIGDKVDISGTSKGKGFQGVVKRHHFAGGPRTHGQSDRERAPGSIGQTTTPGRVYKGKRMAGRMGSKRVTIKNLEVIKVDKNGLIVKGLVPGAIDSLLEIKTVS